MTKRPNHAQKLADKWKRGINAAAVAGLVAPAIQARFEEVVIRMPHLGERRFCKLQHRLKMSPAFQREAMMRRGGR